MPALTVYRLTFHSGLHIGTQRGRLGASGVTVPSGTLFAALVDVLARTGRDPAAFVAPFLARGAEGPPFLLTSAFPFAGDVHFFPMPVPLQRWFDPETTLKARRKAVKRVAFVSQELLVRMARGERMDAALFPEASAPADSMPDAPARSGQGVALQGGAFWLTPEECERLPDALRFIEGRRVPQHALRHRRVFARARTPRVTVDRITAASDIFHSGRVSFAPGCGLWFGAQWLRRDHAVGETALTFAEAFAQAHHLLGEDGLGGERSVGYGAFDVETLASPLALPDVAPGQAMLLLSRYHPRGAELPQALAGEAGYALLPQGGWVGGQRRRQLWLVKEGSVIQAVGDGPWGDVVDVRPGGPAGERFPHPVWRYGMALGAGLKEVAHA